MKKLKAPDSHLRPFLSLAQKLRKHPDPTLVLSPPHWNADAQRLDTFPDEAPSKDR